MQVTIAERAVTKVVAAATASVPGTIGFSTSVGRLTGRGFPRFDVQLDFDADTATVEAFIAVTWPSPVTTIATTVRDQIIADVRTFCGIEVLACNVVVGSVLTAKTRVTADELSVQAAVPRRLPDPAPLKLKPVYLRGHR